MGLGGGAMDVDPAGAHSVFGGVASLRWDAESVREHFRIALQHADSPETHHNYSIALYRHRRRLSPPALAGAAGPCLIPAHTIARSPTWPP